MKFRLFLLSALFCNIANASAPAQAAAAAPSNPQESRLTTQEKDDFSNFIKNFVILNSAINNDKMMDLIIFSSKSGLDFLKSDLEKEQPNSSCYHTALAQANVSDFELHIDFNLPSITIFKANTSTNVSYRVFGIEDINDSKFLTYLYHKAKKISTQEILSDIDIASIDKNARWDNNNLLDCASVKLKPQ